MSTSCTTTPPGTKHEPARTASRYHLQLDFLERNFGLDVRSLALFRVSLAVIILGDLFNRARDLNAFYTDFGTLPRHLFTQFVADQWIVSLHLMSGKWQVEAFLFMIAAIFAVMMLFGWRTRIATVASWVLLMSLQNRNPLILQGGDTLLRMLMFWAMFLPLGLANSVDAGLDPDPDSPKPKRIFTAATVALMVQIAIVYWFAVMLKRGPEWRSEGSAVYYVLSLEQLATPFGRWLLNFPGFLRFLTFFTLVIETLAPIFLFIPFLVGQIRTSAVLFLVGLQLGFASFLHVGHFPFVASAMMVAMLPSWFWDSARPKNKRLEKRLEERSGLNIFYDADCSFCRKFVLILRALVLSSDVPVLAAQDDAKVERAMRAENSWVVQDAHGKFHFKTSALAEVLAHSPIFLLWPLAWTLRLPPILAVADKLYRWVEQNRPRLSRATSFVQYRPLRWHARPITNTVVTFFLVYVIWWNIGTVEATKAMPVEYRWVGVLFRIDQIWDMFSPGPLREDGWYVIDATLKNGEHIDLFRNGAPVSYARPTADEVAAQYKDERWRKYLLNLYGEEFAPYRLYYGRYLCRVWNEGKSASDPTLVNTFDINFMVRSNVAIGVALPVQKWVLHQHDCWK